MIECANSFLIIMLLSNTNLILLLRSPNATHYFRCECECALVFFVLSFDFSIQVYILIGEIPFWALLKLYRIDKVSKLYRIDFFIIESAYIPPKMIETNLSDSNNETHRSEICCGIARVNFPPLISRVTSSFS
jgi:hypothetical protein